MVEKILIVDDDLDTLRLIGIVLEREGYQVSEASNGDQAILLAKSLQPNLVLLDLMMPGMDGIEVARNLRADPHTNNILIIILTAKSDLEDKLEGFDIGADDYLTKPIQHPELVAHVKAVLKRAGRIKKDPIRGLEKPGKVISVLSAKGGLGVTTVALNLGFTIHDLFNDSVLVSDLKPGYGRLGLDLGFFNFQTYTQLLSEDLSDIELSMIVDSVLHHESGLKLLLSSPYPRDSKYADRSEMFELIVKGLSRLSQYTVLDLPVSLSLTNQRVISLSDIVLIVLEPVPQTIFQSKMLLDDLYTMGVGKDNLSYVLLNRVVTGSQLSLSEVQDQLGEEIQIIIPTDEELAYQSLVNNSPLIYLQSDGIITQQFIKLAEHIIEKCKTI